jgi:hypothetical protein
MSACVQVFGHGAMSDLSPLCAPKAEVERHHDMDRAGNLWRCADRCYGDFELMIE